MANRQGGGAGGLIGHASLPAPIPAGDQTVWADAGPLIVAACNVRALFRLGRCLGQRLALRGLLIMRAICNALVSVVSDARTNESCNNKGEIIPVREVNGSSDLRVEIRNGNPTHYPTHPVVALTKQAVFIFSLSCTSPDDIEPLQRNPDLEEGYCRALLCRLRFRKVRSPSKVLNFEWYPPYWSTSRPIRGSPTIGLPADRYMDRSLPVGQQIGTRTAQPRIEPYGLVSSGNVRNFDR
ncbi:Mak10 subunit, NatC N(alpha)-terminal acetyltransferase [Musa troglodytarum]|uniref:Mak10 subunit, NatC N(Alpha)-terminal acetyltransferase n=1 Tax=Musa troglodytarum TaxID=320322 RepID=A0A9E7KMW3_9LILI|nr:Mak10 subunit, NatC N(alpha)-terminal acetyltransferase [Musa troglodytarum]